MIRLLDFMGQMKSWLNILGSSSLFIISKVCINGREQAMHTLTRRP